MLLSDHKMQFNFKSIFSFKKRLWFRKYAILWKSYTKFGVANLTNTFGSTTSEMGPEHFNHNVLALNKFKKDLVSLLSCNMHSFEDCSKDT